jgi:hypothetical protein
MKVNLLCLFKTNLYLHYFFIAEGMGKTKKGIRLFPAGTVPGRGPFPWAKNRRPRWQEFRLRLAAPLSLLGKEIRAEHDF